MAQITEKQKSFINKLCAERPSGIDYVGAQLSASKVETVDELTMTVASSVIAALLQCAKALPVNYVTEVGIYKGSDGHMYKVQESKYNPGKFYAKRLMVSSVGVAKFEYDPSGMKKITPADKVALGDAVAFGQKFGVCCQCSRTLTDPNSVAAGIGPICAGKF